MKLKQLHMIITGEYFTKQVRSFALEHKINLANEWFDNLIPKPEPEHRKAVLLGNAEFTGATICGDPKCDQCKNDKPFAMIYKEDLQYQESLKKHKKLIKENYIEIDENTITKKENITNLIESQSKIDELKELRNKDDDEEIKSDNPLKSKIIEAEDYRDLQIEKFYQEHGISSKFNYEIGSNQWKAKLEVDGLLEVIKAKSLGDKNIEQLLKKAKEEGELNGISEVNRRKEHIEWKRNSEEIKKTVKPDKEKINVGKFSIPKNLLEDYVESVRSMRTQMTIGMSRQDPIIGANALALRIKQHKRIFEALKIPYHGDDKSTKKSNELYNAVEKYIEKKYPDLTLGNIAKKIKGRKNE